MQRLKIIGVGLFYFVAQVKKMVDMLTRRGVVVVRLLSQTAGRDDRQLLVLPPGAALPSPSAPEDGAPEAEAEAARPQDVRYAPKESSVFPNVPYEEAKYSGGGG